MFVPPQKMFDINKFDMPSKYGCSNFGLKITASDF